MPALPISYSAASSRQSSEQTAPLASLDPRQPTDYTDLVSSSHYLHTRADSSSLLETSPNPFLEPLESFSLSTTPSTAAPLHQDALAKRQSDGDVVAIPLTYNFEGPAPGVTVGITLGSVAGFLILFWLVMFATLSNRSGMIEGDEITDVHVARASDRSRRSRRRRTTRTHRSETSEVSAHPAPAPRRTERIVVQETRRTERSVPPPARSEVERESTFESVRERETERRVDGDDVVEVIEEHSELSEELPRRKKSGYRTVDPSAYAGGNFAQRDVYGSRGGSKRR